MATTPAGLLAGPAIRLLLIIVVVFAVISFVDLGSIPDFGGLLDQIITSGQNLLTDLINPF